MGVDARVLATKADRSIDVDRCANIEFAYEIEDNKLFNVISDLHHRASEGKGITASEMIRYAKAGIYVFENEYAVTANSRLLSKIFYLDCLIAFAKKYPKDKFKIYYDSHPDYHDLNLLDKDEKMIDWQEWRKARGIKDPPYVPSQGKPITLKDAQELSKALQVGGKLTE